jgi:hypothetical protein
MNIDQWITVMSDAYRFSGIRPTISKIEYLLSTKDLDECTGEEKKTYEDAKEVFLRYLFHKATIGESFGDLVRVKKEYGYGMREIRRIPSGPCKNLAIVFWTLEVEYRDTWGQGNVPVIMTEILSDVSTYMARLFFPTGGIEYSMGISKDNRRETQRVDLKKYAPEMDIKRCLAENPYLNGGRAGCLGLVLLVTFVTAAICQ